MDARRPRDGPIFGWLNVNYADEAAGYPVDD